MSSSILDPYIWPGWIIRKSIDRVDTRARLPARREPYWYRLSEGRSLGYRRLTKSSPGNWIARAYDGEGYRQHPLGDFVTLSEKERFDSARAAADAWFQHLDMGGSTVRTTIKGACEAYVEHLKIENSEAASNDAKGRFERLVYKDPIARVSLAKLSPRHLADWKKRVLEMGGTRGSFNRNASGLRAALNLAHTRRDVASDHAWSNELKPFKNADGRRDLYLKRPARAKLLDKASSEGRRFIISLLLVPFRPGDVAKLKVEYFSAQHRALKIPTGKTKMRLVPLGSEAVAHFKECSNSKLPSAWLVSRDDGSQWKKEAWRDEINAAGAAAKLPAETCAYTLRHCVITDLVVGGLDLFTVAKIAGTSIVMIEKNYGHLQREHARAALERLALV